MILGGEGNEWKKWKYFDRMHQALPLVKMYKYQGQYKKNKVNSAYYYNVLNNDIK